MGLFLVGKLFFLLVNSEFAEILSALIPVWWHGLVMDLSVASYLVLPLVLLVWIPISLRKRIWKAYLWFSSALIILIHMLDPFFYHYWGSKVNLLFVQYLGDPKAAAGSIALWDYAHAVAFLMVVFVLVRWHLNTWKMSERKGQLLLVLWLPLIVVLGRGGIGKVPVNISSAYYSHSALENNAAVNAPWNLVAYELNRAENQYHHLLGDEERETLMEAWKLNTTPPIAEVRLNDSSRVILIIMESMSAKMSALLSAKAEGYTPILDSLADQGIYYSKAYAGSFRSDKGLTSLITGQPVYADQTITNLPEQLSKLPNLFQLFSAKGYSSSFHYGGDLSFANVELLILGADRIVSRTDMDQKLSSVWGVHDQVSFIRFAEDVQQQERPSFNVLFSLSAHEPFEVPSFNRHQDPYINSIAYADSCLGLLVSSLRARGEWDNSLVVITADHGSRRPENSVNYKALNYRIPIVLTGGLITKDTAVHEVVSQFDIPYTLAECVGEEGQFRFSHSLMRPRGMAFFNYYNGLTVINDSCVQHYDLPMQRYLEEKCMPPYEKAYYQTAQKMLLEP